MAILKDRVKEKKDKKSAMMVTKKLQMDSEHCGLVQ